VSVLSRAAEMPMPDERRADAKPWRRRGWLMRRLLLAADIVGLSLAFAVTEVLYGSSGRPDTFDLGDEIVLFFLLVPMFVVGAKLLGLYDRDEERTSNTTTDDLARVFLLSTTGIFVLSRAVFLVRGHNPDPTKMTAFWLLLFGCVAVARACARTAARRTAAYVQNTVIVGTDDVGQLIGRKLLQHREYGVNLVGFVDSRPRPLRPELDGVNVLATPSELCELAQKQRVDRVIFAFSNEPHDVLLQLVRKLRDGGVQVDVVPRFFEVVGPKTNVHDVEGVALVGLPAVKLPRSSQMAKRALDVAVSGLALLVAAPLLGVIALAITLDSAGPVLFCQRRLGEGHARVHRAQVPNDERQRRRVRASRLHRGDDERESGCRRERSLQARSKRRDHARRPMAPEDEPRRAAAARERPEGRHVTRRAAPMPRVRSGALPAAPL